MAVERLYEVAEEGRYARVILDTPPTRQAIDFLEAPSRIVEFLDSGALRIALGDWFDAAGQLRGTRRLGPLGRGLEGLLDRVVGLELLRDMSEFFRAFEPLFDGFRQRAKKVEALLASNKTLFVLVAGPGEEKIADTLFFARKLEEAGFHLGPMVVNRVHPQPATDTELAVTIADGEAEWQLGGRRLFRWLGERHQQGLESLRGLLSPQQSLVALPLQADEPTDLASLRALGEDFQRRLECEMEETRHRR